MTTPLATKQDDRDVFMPMTTATIAITARAIMHENKLAMFEMMILTITTIVALAMKYTDGSLRQWDGNLGNCDGGGEHDEGDDPDEQGKQ